MNTPLGKEEGSYIPTPLKEWEENYAPIIGGLSILVSFSIRGHK
jgi:hypothetical protein